MYWLLPVFLFGTFLYFSFRRVKMGDDWKSGVLRFVVFPSSNDVIR